MKRISAFIWEIIKIVIIALVVVIPIRYFLFQPFLVRGESMNPTFKNGDYLIVDEISYRFRDPQRGEVVVFKYPSDPHQRYIKRIIGLPGETVEIKDGQVIIFNDKGSQILNESDYLFSVETPGDIHITLTKNEYFVLGDNRTGSFDSRRWGPLPRKNIIGRVFIRAWPFVALAKFERHTY